MQWMSTDDWTSTQKQNSSCTIVLTWPLPMLPERQRLGARAERCTPCPCHLYKEVVETQAVAHAQVVGNDDVAKMERAMHAV